MKRFVYFENEDGGLSYFFVHKKEDLMGLYGWMSDDIKAQDKFLIEWMTKAEIGEMLDHRLGVLVRLKDI